MFTCWCRLYTCCAFSLSHTHTRTGGEGQASGQGTGGTTTVDALFEQMGNNHIHPTQPRLRDYGFPKGNEELYQPAPTTLYSCAHQTHDPTTIFSQPNWPRPQYIKDTIGDLDDVANPLPKGCKVPFVPQTYLIPLHESHVLR